MSKNDFCFYFLLPDDTSKPACLARIFAITSISPLDQVFDRVQLIKYFISCRFKVSRFIHLLAESG